MGKILNATHDGILTINDIELNVAVLEDGTRVITQNAVFKALGRESRGNSRVIGVPAFMDAKNLQPLISSELKDVINKIEYVDKNNKVQQGFNADILPLVSDLYLKARENGDIKQKNQLETAYKAEILVRALAKVGITALVDEATGYQYDRERFELQKILNAYIADEIVKWQLTFTDEFYREVFRLWNLPFIPKYIKNKPSFIGKITTKYVYDVLPEGVVEKIREVNPKTKKGHWKYKFHQLLSPEIGREHLKKQIIETTLIMRMSRSKEEFIKRFNDMYGKNLQLELDFRDDDDELIEIEPKKSKFNKNLEKALGFNPNKKQKKHEHPSLFE